MKMMENYNDLTEKFYLIGADPEDAPAAIRVKQYILAKNNAGFLKQFNYQIGYTKLQHYIMK